MSLTGTRRVLQGHLLELLIAAQGGIHRWNRPIRDVIARKDVIEDGLGPFLVARFFHAKPRTDCNGAPWPACCWVREAYLEAKASRLAW